MNKTPFAWSEVTVKLLDESDTPLSEGATEGRRNKFEITAGSFGASECRTLKLFKARQRIFMLNYELDEPVAIDGDLSVDADGMLVIAGDTSDVTAYIHVDDEV